MKFINFVIFKEPIPVSNGSVNSELIGGIVGALLSVIVAVVILLTVLCLYRRYHCTAKISMKEIDL